MRVLLIEDEQSLCTMLADSLKAHGYDVDIAFDGDTGLEYILMSAHDIVLLDRMLPQKDGISILKTARNKGIATPVLMLTAMDAVGDAVLGLDCGADDYLAKPFELEMLLARMRALLRRPNAPIVGKVLEYGDIKLDILSHEITGPSGSKVLTRTEYELLAFLIKCAGKPAHREIIIMRVWGAESDIGDGNLGSYTFMVRRRLKQIGSNLSIKTLRGIGYCLEKEHL